MSVRLAVLTSRLRVEEKLLLTELQGRDVPFLRLDDAALALSVAGEELPYDLVWSRSLAFGRTLYAQRILESRGVRTLNSAAVVETCGDKLLTSLALAEAGIPSLRTAVAFTPASALELIESMGYPVVLKPVVGSWGRLIARLDGRAAAEAVLEDRATLGNWQQQIFYVQEYVEKPGRDARVFVIGSEAVAGIWRESEHWITNTARGGRVSACDISGELGELACRAAQAVGGGMLAVDILETPQGPAVIEVNHSCEFRNSIAPTGVNLPGLMVDYVLTQMEVGEQPANGTRTASGGTMTGVSP